MRQAYYIKNQKGEALAVDIPIVSQEEIEDIDLSKVAYWLIDMADWQSGWDSLCFIRRHSVTALYLKPVIFLLHDNEVPNEIKISSDGAIDNVSLNSVKIEEWISKLEPVNTWIDRLEEREQSKELNLSFKILRLIASRNIELKPIKTIRRTSGFVYPLIEPLFTVRDTGVMEMLSFLQGQSLLSETFLTRAHFCGHCSSAFLNFKETCPHCSSDDLTVDELVHHFKCAYTAELAEFKSGGQLVCPKCELTLRHIGIDYDKPSTVNQCNQCNHRFQDPVVMTDCYSCGRSAEPSSQDVQNVYSYTISAIGQNSAYYGLDALFTSLLEKQLDLHSLDAFKGFFHVEAARITRYKISSSSLVMINFKELDNLYIKLGKKAKQVFGELSSIFKAVFRESDIISAYNESVFFVLMTETNVDDANRGLERLSESVKSLFENNMDVKLEVHSVIKAIDDDLSLDDTLEVFLSDTLLSNTLLSDTLLSNT